MSYINAGGGGGGSGVLGPVVMVPSSSSDTGTPYEIAFDGLGNLYICYATNTWAKYDNTAPFGSDVRVTQTGDTRTTQGGDTRIRLM